MQRAKAQLTPQQLRSERSAANRIGSKRIDLDGKVTGVFADYQYVGTGDIGGATSESTVRMLEAIVNKSETVLPPHAGRYSRPQDRRSDQGPEVTSAKAPCT